MAEISFNGATYTYPEAQAPYVYDVSGNPDGSETVTFRGTDPGLGYTYAVSITDAYGDVHIHEGNPSAPDFTGNDYYGQLTGYNNGGDFTVLNNTEGPPGNSVSSHFTWLFTSAVDNTGMVTLYPDDRGGAFVPPVCYAEGSRILTTRGEVAVEALQVGDLVITAAGDHRPIRWLGSRTIDCRSHPDPRAVWPVRIAAHAFGADRPARDLYVSPGHAICVSVVEDVLIPASALVNGSTVTQVEVDTVTYWHVELDSHDVLLAENLPAESYRDVGNRGFFVEADVVDLAAGPDGPAAATAGSALPFTDRGPVLDAVRIGLRARALKAGWTLDAAPFAGLHVVADGVVVQPEHEGLVARFVLPASAAEVWLVSGTSVPFDIGDNPDRRRLGVSLCGLTIDDGLMPRRAVPLDDPRLGAGFHPVERLEAGERRWTDGRAHLPAALWEGCRGSFFLRVELTGPALPRWVAPQAGLPAVLEPDRAAKAA